MQSSLSVPELNKEPRLSSRKPLIITRRDGSPVIVQRNKGSENSDADEKMIPGDVSGEPELCPFCKTISFPYEALLNHIVTCHNLTDNVLREINNGGTKCLKCGGITRTPQAAVKHACLHHSVEVIRVVNQFNRDLWELRVNDINEFLKRHEPEGGFGIVRNGPISSSSEDEEEATNEDREYLQFIASTIHKEGVATKPSGLLDLSRIKVRKETDTDAQSFESVVEKLSDYECFLRVGNLISTGRPFGCVLCTKSFQSITQLVAHCYAEHKLKVSQDVRNILWVFKPDLPDALPEAELIRYPSLRLDLLLHTPLIQPRNPRFDEALNVPDLMASLVLELLAVGAVPCRCLATKEFHEPTVVMLRVPAPIPVIFTNSERLGITRIGFINTPFISAIDMRSRVEFVLNNLVNYPALYAKFSCVDNVGFTQEDLIGLAEKFNVVILKTPDVLGENGIGRNFDVVIVSKSITDKDLQDGILDELRSWCAAATIGKCRKCCAIYNVNIVEKCKPRRIGNSYVSLKGTHDVDENQCVSSGKFNTDLLRVFL